MPRPTASSLWLAELCPASHVLPQIRVTTAAQSRGSWVHKYLELAPQIGQEAALGQLPEEYRELCAEFSPESIPQGQREVAISYDLEAGCGMVLGNLHREYPDAPHLACGTIDVLDVQSHAVWDYKTGHPGPAAESVQLLFLGLAAARAFYWLYVEVGHLRAQDGRLRPDSVVLQAIDLAAAHQRIARVYQRYEETKAQAAPDVHPGDHCAMCAAAPACPATYALTRQINEALSPPDRDLRELVTSDPAMAARFLKRVDTFADLVRAELRRQAAVAPIDLGNGKELRLVPVDKSRIDGKIGLPVLRDLLGDRADAACSVTKTALAKVAGKGAAQVLLDRLRNAGALIETEEQHLREVKKEDAA